MFSLVLKTLLSLMVGICIAFASDSADEKETPKKKTSEESYAVVQARVQGLEAKIRSAENEIQKLILEKQRTKDSSRVSEIIRQMLTLHKEMENNIKDYDQQRALLKYRYPEKGHSDRRDYERIEVKSIEEMEHQMSLSASVKKTLHKVRMQYEKPETEPADKQAVVEEKKKSPESAPGLADPVILKK